MLRDHPRGVLALLADQVVRRPAVLVDDLLQPVDPRIALDSWRSGRSAPSGPAPSSPPARRAAPGRRSPAPRGRFGRPGVVPAIPGATDQSQQEHEGREAVHAPFLHQPFTRRQQIGRRFLAMSARRARGRCGRHHHSRRRRPGGPHDRHRARRPRPARPRHGHGHGDKDVRFATFNASLNRGAAGQLVDRPLDSRQRPGEDGRGDHPAQPARRAARQRVRLRRGWPGGQAVPRELPRGLAERRPPGALPLLLRRGVQHRYPQRLRPQQQRTPIGGGDDAFGFGAYPGQFGLAVFSKYPIDYRHIRTFQHFLWKDMPGAMLPDDPATPAPADWYSPDGARRLPALQQVPLGRARSTWAARPCTSWSRTRPRRCSTAPRTATAPGTSTRSGSGPTTCAAARRRRTSTTTRAGTAGCAPVRSS